MGRKLLQHQINLQCVSMLKLISEGIGITKCTLYKFNHVILFYLPVKRRLKVGRKLFLLSMKLTTTYANLYNLPISFQPSPFYETVHIKVVYSLFQLQWNLT